jgi:hypothetical protein
MRQAPMADQPAIQPTIGPTWLCCGRPDAEGRANLNTTGNPGA